jgi:tetratricopeptide (TPR) repeat protein
VPPTDGALRATSRFGCRKVRVENFSRVDASFAATAAKEEAMRAFIRPALVVFSFVLCVRAADLNREIVLAPQTGAAREDSEIRRWQDRVRVAEGRASDYERLAWAFVAKARRTTDAGYFKLAEKTVDLADARFGATAESRLLRGHVLHNLHRFAEAEAIGRELAVEWASPASYALLSDALMEQGHLQEAVAALQRSVDLKPGPEADARIAHLRWLKGDLRGAIAAMEAAANETGAREGESCAWMRARLAIFYLQAGAMDRALAESEQADTAAGDFAPALLARGRVLIALGRNRAAVDVLRRAAALTGLPEYQWWLADALRAVDEVPEANRVEAMLRDRGAATDPRTLALFLATRDDEPALAVQLAREELTHRADVFSHDALAWALFSSGDATAAAVEMRAALAVGTQDARLFLHAAEIECRLGHAADARRFAALARTLATTLTPSERQRLDRWSAGVAGSAVSVSAR